MPTYQPLGARTATGVISSGVNSGNWQVQFPPNVLDVHAPSEVYHIVISGPAGSSFDIYLGSDWWDSVERGDLNSWDPSQPLEFADGQTIYFNWNTSSGDAPRVTVWLRSPL